MSTSLRSETITRQILPSLAYLFKDKFLFGITTGVFVFSLVVCLLKSILAGIFLLGSFFCGCLTFHLLKLFRNDNITTLLLSFLPKKETKNGRVVALGCCICGEEKCQRHSPNLKIGSLQPWLNLHISPQVDAALEQILCLLLKEHVYSWYKDISMDEDFVLELKHSLRYLFASLFKKAKQVDLVNLILGPVTQAGLEHLGSYLQVAKAGDIKVEHTVLRQHGPHTAVSSRANEVLYLRKLTDTLLPHVLPSKQLQCQNAATLIRELLCSSVILPIMDLLADPDVINHLLVIFFDKTPMVYYPKSSELPVEFLSNFVGSSCSVERTNSVCHFNLDTILSQQELLYTFMQFLKEEASVNVLQFCLTVDEFSQKLLNPEIGDWELLELHTEAFHIYDNYMAPHALDKILFDDDIVNDIKTIVESPPKNVVKLQNTSSLFKAHQQAYLLLENTLCPLFHQSDRYFELLTGGKLGDKDKNVNKPEKKLERPSSTKIKSHLKENYTKRSGIGSKSIFYDKQFNSNDLVEDLEEPTTPLEDMLFSDQQLEGFFEESYRLTEDVPLKNLSAWRVFVPQVETRMDHNCRYYHTFVIDVQRLDVSPKDSPEDLHWTVERKYHEFYVLEAKLIEFHRELPDIHLPPKRTLGTKGKQFMESKRLEFEQFIQRLLSVPSLQSSELMYMFLKSRAQFTTSFLPDLKLGKIIKNVPKRLLKEKGQHLNTFLNMFIGSTEPTKPKPGRLETKGESPEKQKLDNALYNGARPCMQEVQTKTTNSSVSFTTLYEVLHFLAIKVYKIHSRAIQFICMFDPFLAPSLQTFVENYLSEKLDQAFRPQRMIQLIELLQEVLFLDKEIKVRSSREKLERAREAFNQVTSFFPDLLVRVIGKDTHEQGTQLIFNLLQYPLLNKQLTYVLLDILVQKMFPEIKWPSP